MAAPARKVGALLTNVRELILQTREGVARAVDSELTTVAAGQYELVATAFAMDPFVFAYRNEFNSSHAFRRTTNGSSA